MLWKNKLWIKLFITFVMGVVNTSNISVLQDQRKVASNFIVMDSSLETNTSAGIIYPSQAVSEENNGCEIYPTLKNTSPLLIISGTTTIIYPEPGSNTTRFAKDQLVDFACLSNRYLNFNGETLSTAICIDKETFLINGATVEWKDLNCTGNVIPNILEITDLGEDDTMISCYNNALQTERKIASIGFSLDGERNITLIKICFDFVNKITLFSTYNITSAIGNSAKNVNPPSFKQDPSIYSLNISLPTWYKNNQSTINNILGLNNMSTNYVNNATFINRGHLAAKADFMYAAMQVATYRYINAAPQWSSINGGNWNRFENGVRNYAISKQTDLQIWTGTYGISNLPNINTTFEDIYIYFNQTDPLYSPSIPIPALFWKLVYNPINHQGIILVGHNNPYENETIICDNDVSSNITWIRWNQNTLKRGYSYACEYNDNIFQNTVAYVPKLNVTGLLV